MKPGKHQSGKQRGQDGGWKVHDRALLLFFTRTLCMNYVIAMFLLVSCMDAPPIIVFCLVLCTVNPPKSEQKPTYNKELWWIS